MTDLQTLADRYVAGQDALGQIKVALNRAGSLGVTPQLLVGLFVLAKHGRINLRYWALLWRDGNNTYSAKVAFQRGLVWTEKSKTDGRVTTIELTDQGRALLDRVAVELARQEQRAA